MGRPRLQLHSLLETIADNVYFQPPTSMDYPCIVYELDDDDVQFADNQAYRHHDGYQIKVIDRDPDSDIRKQVAELPMCRFSRRYTADNLNHFVYNLFF